MIRLFTKVLDINDHLQNNKVEKVAELANSLGEHTKEASLHTQEEREECDENEVALILFHPKSGTMKKYACDNPGITELNINLLSEQVEELPDELIKKAANNLGYVAQNYGIDIPNNLVEYQTESWEDPHLNITYIDKSAFYDKVEENQPIEKTGTFALPGKQKYQINTADQIKLACDFFTSRGNTMNIDDKIEFSSNLVKQAEHLGIEDVPEEVEDYSKLDTESKNEDFENRMRVRIKLAGNEEGKEFYSDVLENHDNYELGKLQDIISKGDEMFNKQAVNKGMIKNAELSTYQVKESSWLDKLADKDLDYIDKHTKQALLSKEGEHVFESLPKPTKDRLKEDLQ